MKTELDAFYELIEDIDTAMMTTRRADGHLRSRAMANQRQANGADLWFVTADGTAKLADLAGDPHVNLSDYRDSKPRVGVCFWDSGDRSRPGNDRRAVRS